MVPSASHRPARSQRCRPARCAGHQLVGPAQRPRSALPGGSRLAEQSPRPGRLPGGDYLPSPLWKPPPDDFEGVAAGVDKPLGLTVHPLGGCPMGDGPDSGVVNWQGTVFRADGSPATRFMRACMCWTAACCPRQWGQPFVTIAGLSLVAARAILRADGCRRSPRTTCTWACVALSAPAPVAQASVAKPPAAAEQPVRLQFREHLQGHWQTERPDWAPAANPQWTDDERTREWGGGGGCRSEPRPVAGQPLHAAGGRAHAHLPQPHRTISPSAPN